MGGENLASECTPLADAGFQSDGEQGGESAKPVGTTGNEANNNTISTDNPFVEDTVAAPSNSGYYDAEALQDVSDIA
jgi:hypothetical protein